MKVLLTGSNGQLGKAIIAESRNYVSKFNIELIQSSRHNMDLSNYEECKKIINFYKPDWVLNAGAYTLVDKAESQVSLAYAVNAKAPAAFVEVLETFGGRLLQVSTDFVFNGKQGFPYLTNQNVDPLGVYGSSKAEGEKAALEYINSRVLRTSWVYGPTGKNFFLTILRLHSERSKNGQSLQVVSDQIGVPTSTKTLAKACWKSIFLDSNNDSYRILHWTDAGAASWFDFAVSIGEIAAQLNIIESPAEVIPISTKEYPTPARRPPYSILDCIDTREALSLNPVHWRKALENVLHDLKNQGT